MIATSPSSRRRPATTISNVLSSPSWKVGCAIHSPLKCASRTAPIGPLNGIPETVSAADAPLIDAMSCGFTWSAPRMVAMTCTSLRKSAGNDGRSGRSVRRHVRIASSPGRPSRRKNEPGILPAAYMRSSTSTVSGKKSMPSRGFDVQTVDRSVVSPTLTRTAPSARFASLPRLEGHLETGGIDGTGNANDVVAHARIPLSLGSIARVGSQEVSVPSCQRPSSLRGNERALATDNRRRSCGLRMSNAPQMAATRCPVPIGECPTWR